MSALLELVRWWALTTGLCAVLLVGVVVVQFAQQVVRRRAVRRRPRWSGSTAMVRQPLPR